MASGFIWLLDGRRKLVRNVMERASILAGDAPPDAAIFSRILGTQAATEEEDLDLNIRKRVDSLERRLISTALKRAEGRKRDAALLLGVDPKNLGYYLRKHDIEEPEEVSGS